MTTDAERTLLARLQARQARGRRGARVEIDDDLAGQLVDLEVGEVRLDEPLSRWTAFGAGGPAGALVHVDDAEALARLLAWCRGARLPVRLLGEGCGLAVRQGGLDGVVVRTDRLLILRRTDTQDELFPRASAGGLPRVLAGAGVRPAELARFVDALGGQLDGEVARSPGTIGGLVCRAWPTARRQVAAVAMARDRGGVKVRPAEEFTGDTLPRAGRTAVVWVVFAPDRRDEERAARIPMDAAAETEDRGHGKIRLFRDEGDVIVADVLRGLDVRGIRLRQVAIDEEDPNLARNLGGGTADDLTLLADYVGKRVLQETGTQLAPAFKVLGKKLDLGSKQD